MATSFKHTLANKHIVVPVGTLYNAQPHAMRAPEVLLGKACREPSQVWATAATLLFWIMPGIVGVWDSPHVSVNEAWALAKIKRLFPEWNIPSPTEVDDNFVKATVKHARSFTENAPELQAILPFNELAVEVPHQLKDLLHFMLIPNPAERPSASSVLASREFRVFEKFVEV